jgi:hypothetical protein
MPQAVQPGVIAVTSGGLKVGMSDILRAIQHRLVSVSAAACLAGGNRFVLTANHSYCQRNSRVKFKFREGIMSSRHSRGAAITAAGCITALAACGGGNGSSGYMAPPNPAPSAAFSMPAQATTIHLGQSVALAWAATYATTCTASTSSTTGGSFTGTVSVSGTQTVAPTAAGSVTYTLTCAGAGGIGSASSQMITVEPSILSGLSTITTIGPTPDPVEKGGNPYGLAIAPLSAGLITQGDLIVCNFNDGATNTQGHGTTIVGLHPAAGAMPYSIANSPQLLGCNALAMFADDSIAAAAWGANLIPLVGPAGTVGNPFAGDAFSGPWGEAYVPAAGNAPPALYVSNEQTGSIDRIVLNGDAPTSFTEIASGFCVSGAPGALFGPAGLTYDSALDTLYIVDTGSYSVVALSSVSEIGADGVIVNGTCGATTPTPALTFSGPSAASARVIAAGGQFNAPLSAALLSDGDLVVANADINNPATPNLLFEISPALGFVGTPLQLDTSGTAGALFGVAATVDTQGNQIIYFNDDNTNTVNMLSH